MYEEEKLRISHAYTGGAAPEIHLNEEQASAYEAISEQMDRGKASAVLLHLSLIHILYDHAGPRRLSGSPAGGGNGLSLPQRSGGSLSCSRRGQCGVYFQDVYKRQLVHRAEEEGRVPLIIGDPDHPEVLDVYKRQGRTFAERRTGAVLTIKMQEGSGCFFPAFLQYNGFVLAIFRNFR